MKNEALDPLPMRRGRRSRVMDGGGPLKAKRGSLNPEGELLKKVDDLRVSGGAHANGEDRVRGEGGGKTMEDGKGRVCRARGATVEREVEGKELHPPRARGPGKGEPRRHDMTCRPNHTMPPKAVREQCESKAVWRPRMGSAGDPQHSQTATHRCRRKKGQQLSEGPRGEVARKEMRSIRPARPHPVWGRQVSQGGTKAVVVGQKKPGIAVVGNGVAQEGVGGKRGPRVTLMLCKAQDRRGHMGGAPIRDIGDPGLCKARSPPLREDGGGGQRIKARGGERRRCPIGTGGAGRVGRDAMGHGEGRRGRKTGRPRRRWSGRRHTGPRASGEGVAH